MTPRWRNDLRSSICVPEAVGCLVNRKHFRKASVALPINVSQPHASPHFGWILFNSQCFMMNILIEFQFFMKEQSRMNRPGWVFVSILIKKKTSYLADRPRTLHLVF